MPKYAVIDLGTNTFHLLVVEMLSNGDFRECHRQRLFVKLAEEGIERIAPAPFQRGIEAIQQFQKVLDQQEIKKVKAFGTAALRTASNAASFIQQIKETTGIKVDIIGGEKEAQLIYQGVQKVVSFGNGNGLIMDIGGGSVEFILANDKGILWSASFPIGVAVLTKKFHQTEPISPQNIESLQQYLDKTLMPLREVLVQHEVAQLIGASGTFDVLESILSPASENPFVSSFPSVAFAPFYQQLIATTLGERLQMATIPDSRAEMIITALILIQYILDLSKAPIITVSAYAMKEGMLDSLG